VSAEATLFHISANRKRSTAEKLLGDDPDALTTSDRFTAYARLDPQRHQTCWAHLLRAFKRFRLRDGPSAQVGGMLEMYGDYLLHRWREVKRGHLSRADFLNEVPQHQALCVTMSETTSPTKFRIEFKGGEQDANRCHKITSQILKYNRRQAGEGSLPPTNGGSWPRQSSANMANWAPCYGVRG
jgi:hypothetical protein